MTIDAARLKEARAALLTIATTILTILKHGDPKLIVTAADSLEAVTSTTECRLAVESLEARQSGLN